MIYKEFLNIAVKAALKGGEIVKKGFYNKKKIEYKGFANPVTEYDRESEKVIVDIILKKFPLHSILAEENLSSQGKEEIKWLVDPLDGTVNFTHQIPFVCVSIGVEAEGKIVAGVIYNPILGELYSAVKEEGAYFNKKRIYVSKISDKGKALLVTGFPYVRTGRLEALLEPLREIIPNYSGFRRLGSAALDMSYLARGSFECFYEENLNPWDTAAGKIIIEEAGGRITDYYGNDFDIYGKTILATNGLFHNDMLSILKNVKKPI